MYTIQCDFDGTVITNNVSHILLNAFAPAAWLSIEELYADGVISVEETNRRQFALIRASLEDIQDVVRREVQIRLGFTEFSAYCRREGIDLVIVSNGVDLYVRPVLAEMGLADLEVHCGLGKVGSQGLVVEYRDPWGIPCPDGFKSACLRYLQERGRPLVYIGDGASDASPARQADLIFARHTLLERLHGTVPAPISFETFHDVRRTLEILVEQRIAAS